jgi:hypothetical protein
MKNNTPHTTDDNLIKDMFRDFEPENAPAQLKHQTMNRILQEWSASPTHYSYPFWEEYRLWILSGIAGILILAFLTDYQSLAAYWENLNVSNSTYFKSTWASFESIFSLLQKIPPIYLFIGAGIGILAGFDKMLTKLSGI